MTIKEHIFNNALEKIIAEIPDNLTDIEKARYIYISVGRLLCFDESYLYGKAKVGQMMYKRAKSSSKRF